VTGVPSDTDRIQRLRHTLLFRREPELAMAGPVWQARMPVTEKNAVRQGSMSTGGHGAGIDL